MPTFHVECAPRGTFRAAYEVSGDVPAGLSLWLHVLRMKSVRPDTVLRLRRVEDGRVIVQHPRPAPKEVPGA